MQKSPVLRLLRKCAELVVRARAELELKASVGCHRPSAICRCGLQLREPTAAPTAAIRRCAERKLGICPCGRGECRRPGGRRAGAYGQHTSPPLQPLQPAAIEELVASH